MSYQFFLLNWNSCQNHHRSKCSIVAFNCFEFVVNVSIYFTSFSHELLSNFPSVKNHNFIAKKCFAYSKSSFNKIWQKENPFGIHLKDWATLIFPGDYLLGRVAGRVKSALKPQTLDFNCTKRKNVFSTKTDFGQNSK